MSDCQIKFVLALPHCCGHIRSILIRSDPQGWAHIMERCERQARCERQIARLLCFQAQFTLSAQVIAFTIQCDAQKHPSDKCGQRRRGQWDSCVGSEFRVCLKCRRRRGLRVLYLSVHEDGKSVWYYRCPVALCWSMNWMHWSMHWGAFHMVVVHKTEDGY